MPWKELKLEYMPYYKMTKNIAKIHRIRPDQVKKLQKLEKKTGISMTEWVRRAIDLLPNVFT